jgi:hypothetical protein
MSDFGKLKTPGCGLIVIPTEHEQEICHFEPPFVKQIENTPFLLMMFIPDYSDTFKQKFGFADFRSKPQICPPCKKKLR